MIVYFIAEKYINFNWSINFQVLEKPLFISLSLYFVTCRTEYFKGSEKWTHKLRLFWNSSCRLKKTPSKNEILPWNCLSYFSFIASSFCLLCCFGKPFGLILILIVLVLYFSFINGLNKLLYFLHFKLVITLLVTFVLIIFFN